MKLGTAIGFCLLAMVSLAACTRSNEPQRAAARALFCNSLNSIPDSEQNPVEAAKALAYKQSASLQTKFHISDAQAKDLVDRAWAEFQRGKFACKEAAAPASSDTAATD
jgi:hypothetical protein